MVVLLPVSMVVSMVVGMVFGRWWAGGGHGDQDRRPVGRQFVWVMELCS
jgi:nitrogen fixation-related uncharacterized protein